MIMKKKKIKAKENFISPGVSILSEDIPIGKWSSETGELNVSGG